MIGDHLFFNLERCVLRARAGKEARRIKRTFIKLVENERKCNKNTLKSLRRELNRAVLAPMGMENKAEELEEIIQALLEARVTGGGIHAEVVIGVKESERQKIMRLKGARLKEERTRVITLQDFFARAGA